GEVQAVAFGGAGVGRGGERPPLTVAHLDRDHAVGEQAAVPGPVHLQVIGHAADAAPDRVDVVLAQDEEAVPLLPALPGLERAEEAGLLDEGAAVLRAERVAVAALVAEVLEVRELVLPLHLEAAGGKRRNRP